jgi:UPF0755 protein
MRALPGVLATLVLLAALGAGSAVFAVKRYNAPGPLTASRAVVVPRGTPTVVAEQLAELGVIDGPLPFRIATFATGRKGPLRAGEFNFPEHASLSAVLTILRSGRPVQHLLTIPEGLTAAQIAQILDRTRALDGETPMPAEGEALPETYAFTFGTPRSTVLEHARSAMDRALAQAWNNRAEGLPIATPRDMLTLASIVERETARPEERAHIAAVFLNRLKRGMRLQSDPTVAYAVSGGLSTSDPGLTRAELGQANPYNTYTASGLPPGPIDSPGIAALQAVSHPLATDDLYFVADGIGGHVFAKNLDDHNRNVARWRAQQTR